MLRKSTIGRTELFLPSTTTVLREVQCMGGIKRHDRASVFHALPSVLDVDGVSCWHCCEPVARQQGLPIPRMYDRHERTYHVFGVCCSPGCVKAYIIEHTSFDRGQQLNVFTRMLRDVYGKNDCVVETPPRAALQRFGGPFRAPPNAGKSVDCRILEPPFVSYCMIVEERLQEGAGGATPAGPIATVGMPVPSIVADDMLDGPPEAPLFESFLQERSVTAPAPTGGFVGVVAGAKPPPRATKRSAAEQKATTVGPMSKFLRPA